MERGTGPRGQTPSDGGMFTSDKEGCGIAGGPDGAVELGKISREKRESERNNKSEKAGERSFDIEATITSEQVDRLWVTW